MKEKARSQKRFTVRDVVYISIIFLLTAGMTAMAIMAMLLFTRKTKEQSLKLSIGRRFL